MIFVIVNKKTYLCLHLSLILNDKKTNNLSSDNSITFSKPYLLQKNNSAVEVEQNVIQDTIKLNDSIIRMRNHYLKMQIATRWIYDTYSDSKDSLFEYFVLNLKDEGDSIKGSYCATADNDKSLDCHPTELNIRGRIANGKITAEFYSFLGSKDHKGIAELRLVKDNYLEWKIIKAPPPPFHFPKYALFVGLSPKQPHLHRSQ